MRAFFVGAKMTIYVAIEHFSHSTMGTYEPGERVPMTNQSLAEYFEKRGLIKRYETKPRIELPMDIEEAPTVPLERGVGSGSASSPAVQVSPEPTPKRRGRPQKLSPSTTLPSSE
jgi:hypothetical protein